MLKAIHNNENSTDVEKLGCERTKLISNVESNSQPKRQPLNNSVRCERTKLISNVESNSQQF